MPPVLSLPQKTHPPPPQSHQTQDLYPETPPGTAPCCPDPQAPPPPPQDPPPPHQTQPPTHPPPPQHTSGPRHTKPNPKPAPRHAQKPHVISTISKRRRQRMIHNPTAPAQQPPRHNHRRDRTP